VAACGPERPVAVCRELTKLHEEVWRSSLGEAAKRSSGVKPRGEYVIVLGPPLSQLPHAPESPQLGAVSTEPM
jgi:16S rRNA (cytidine1402-2'-O)-methyltransferase